MKKLLTSGLTVLFLLSFTLVSFAQDEVDTTPRIAYWAGQVNQHVDEEGKWVSDPDQTSGANIPLLTYCKKWYPNTINTENYKYETINTWKRGLGIEQSSYTHTTMTTKCVQPISPTIKILSPNGGEKYYFGNTLSYKFKVQSSKIGTVTISIVDNPSIDNTGHSYTLSKLQGVNPSISAIGEAGNTLRKENPPFNTGRYYLMTEWKSDDGTESIVDFSDNYFMIEAQQSDNGCTSTPSITLHSPNDRDRYRSSQKIKVTWSTCNISTEDKISLEIYKTTIDGNTRRVALQKLIANDGEEEIALPKVNELTYFKIGVSVNGVEDESDTSFIVSPKRKRGRGFPNIESGTTERRQFLGIDRVKPSR
jgi:hypothetical protein